MRRWGYKMKKKYLTHIIGCTFILLLSNSLWNRIAAQEEGPEIYQQEIKPMTSLECGRCHYNVFTDIRDKGGDHQLACRKCHETFHTYKPGKEWKDVVPDCNTCHNQFHGKEFPDCLRCHENAHAPSESLNVEKMAPDCQACHTAPAADFKKFPSAHSEMSCYECHHDKHRYIPTCVECHGEPHTPYVDDAGCIACHPAHSPLEITYTKDVGNDVCAGCHLEAAINYHAATGNMLFFNAPSAMPKITAMFQIVRTAMEKGRIPKKCSRSSKAAGIVTEVHIFFW